MKHLFRSAALMMLAASFAAVSCSKEAKEEESKYEANIIDPFTATNPLGEVFEGIVGKDTVWLKVNPYVDVEEELKDCTPTIFLSRGATISPEATVPQDFGAAGGVKYTVTSFDGKKTHDYIVTWTNSDKMPYGEGFSYCEITDGVNSNYDMIDEQPLNGVTSFTDLGWDGARFDYYNLDGTEKEARYYGDLEVYPGYCKKYIVLLSRIYAVEGDEFNATKVISRDELTLEGNLNLGSISVDALMMIGNDWYGKLVGVVDDGDVNQIYYWEDPFQAPVLVGETPVDIAPFTGDKVDAGNNFQVTGDITTEAYITAQAPRSSTGDQYILTITDGKIASCQTISTGYDSEDTGGWQMISLVTTEVPCSDPDYIVCDNEGERGKHWGNQLKVNAWDGTQIGEPVNPLLQNNLQQWWVGNGSSLYHDGAHRPYMSAMNINGKQYVLFVGGSLWWQAMAVLEYDLELSTLAHENANVAAYTGTVGWSYGGLGAWYWDVDEEAGYICAWFGRAGIITRKLTCFQ